MLLNSLWHRMHLQTKIHFGGGMTELANKYYFLYKHWTVSDTSKRLKDELNIKPFAGQDEDLEFAALQKGSAANTQSFESPGKLCFEKL